MQAESEQPSYGPELGSCRLLQTVNQESDSNWDQLDIVNNGPPDLTVVGHLAVETKGYYVVSRHPGCAHLKSRLASMPGLLLPANIAEHVAFGGYK